MKLSLKTAQAFYNPLNRAAVICHSLSFRFAYLRSFVLHFILVYTQCPLIKSDVKIHEMLREFVALVEDEFNDVSDGNVNTWLSNFIDTEVRLTP